MAEEKLTSKKMGEMPVLKLILIMSAPAMLSMLVQALYNVVDSIFVAQYSDAALKALSLAFPMQLLYMAFAIGVGVGANSLIARKLGEGKKSEASDYARAGLILAVIHYAVFAVLGVFLSGPFMKLYTSDPEVIEMGRQYLTIVMVFSFGCFIEIYISKTLQATGNMIVPMISQLLGAITNIILDPIMIFGKFGFPAMGVRGAAIATVIGQIAAMCFVLIVFLAKKRDVTFSLRGFKPKAEYFKTIYYVGAPSIVLNAIGSFTLSIMNKIANVHYAEGATILGIYFKLQSFVLMPVFGLNQGILPILAYNYGSDDRKRFMQTFKLSIAISLSVMIIGTLIFQIFPSAFLKMFNVSGEMMEKGKVALRIISLCFIFAAVNIICTTMFQSIGHGFKSLFMSVLRQIVIIIPVAFAMGKLIGINGVWSSYPIADLVCMIVFIPLSLKTINKVFRAKALSAESADEELPAENIE